MSKSKPKHTCECADPGCPEHEGHSVCNHRATTCVRRSDMDDRTGTLMCQGCANDMIEALPAFEDVKAFIRATTNRR